MAKAYGEKVKKVSHISIWKSRRRDYTENDEVSVQRDTSCNEDFSKHQELKFKKTSRNKIKGNLQIIPSK